MEKRQILIPLINDYHLFKYLHQVIVLLLERGYFVTLLSAEDKVLKNYGVEHPNFSTEKLNPIIGYLNNRSEKPIFRVLLWLFGSLWAQRKAALSSLVLLPRDNKPLYYLLTRYSPCVVIQPGVGTSEKIFIGELGTGGWDLKNVQLSKRAQLMDLRVAYLRPMERWIDNVFAPGYITAYGDKNVYYGALGDFFGELLLRKGIPRENVFVCGNLNYFVEESKLLANNLDLPISPETEVATIILSSIDLTAQEEEELYELMLRLHSFRKYSFILKSHPRSNKKGEDKLKKRLAEMGVEVLIEGRVSDFLNAQIIYRSEVVLTKSSNLAFMAHSLGKKVVVFDFLKNPGPEFMFFKAIGFRCITSLEELSTILKVSANLSNLEKFFFSPEKGMQVLLKKIDGILSGTGKP